MRLVGLDYGRARIGIAKTDPLRLIVEPTCILKAEATKEKTISALLKLLAPYHPIKAFILGLPLLLNGQEGEMAQEVRSFGEQLHAMSHIPVTYCDERLTSEQAEKALKLRMTRKQRTQYKDALVAAYLLESYLARGDTEIT